MAATVHPITRATDETSIVAAADRLRGTDSCRVASDLADLLDAVATALGNRHEPPMTEAEMWRWSAVVGAARRIAGRAA